MQRTRVKPQVYQPCDLLMKSQQIDQTFNPTSNQKIHYTTGQVSWKPRIEIEDQGSRIGDLENQDLENQDLENQDQGKNINLNKNKC